MIFRVKRVTFAHEVMITCTNDIIRQILRKKINDPPYSRHPLKFLNILNS